MERSARAPLRGRETFWSGDQMTQVLAATGALFRDRDLFVHDGSKLRRFRVSAPVQAVFFLMLMALVAWSSFTTARFFAFVPAAAAAETVSPVPDASS